MSLGTQGISDRHGAKNPRVRVSGWIFKLVDRLTELTRLTNAKRTLSAPQRGIITDTVTMLLSLQDPFNFND